MMVGNHEIYDVKRPHKRPCDLCGEPLTVGQPALRWVWKDDDVLTTLRVHRACHNEATDYGWYTDGDGWTDEFPLREERAMQSREPLR